LEGLLDRKWNFHYKKLHVLIEVTKFIILSVLVPNPQP
jgi:hypothetical protein